MNEDDQKILEVKENFVLQAAPYGKRSGKA